VTTTHTKGVNFEPTPKGQDSAVVDKTIEMRSGRRFTQHFVETRQELDRALLATMRERGGATP
jgi:hypothetical protein